MNSKKILCKKALAAVAALAITAGSAFQTGFYTAKENVVKAADNDNYAKLLQYSLYLYDANMCGKDVESNSLMSWRGNCHTSDEVPGGFHDAGDHAMFGLPQGFTASTLGWGYYEFKDTYDKLGQTAHLKTILNHFIEFFKDSTKLDGSGNVTNFLYQKGNGDEDHAYWGPPEQQGGSRKMYWTSSGASDIAAEYAAALAIHYLNFGDTEALKYAKALYSFSTRYNSVATDGPTGFYNSKSCQDEQAYAAGWLYLATKQESYKSDCASKQDQYLGWVHGWDNVGLGAACVYAHITGDWSKVNGYIGGNCNSNNYFFLDQWGSARLNTSMQFTALVASKNSNADYSSWCKGQMNYILGQNPANTCFVVGYASNSASKPHHRACSGTTTAEDNSSPSKYVLVGALVGGPLDANGTYQDLRSDYKCNEVACDYNAAFVGAAAGLYSVYKTGSLDNSVVGTKAYNPGNTDTPAQTTTVAPSTTTKAPGVTTSVSNPSGGYTLKVNDDYDYSSMDEKMIGFKYEDFGIKAGEKVTKVEFNISTTAGKLGKWQGAVGTSTSVDPDYWTQSEDMEEVFTSNKGTITWTPDSATSKIIQTQYGGEVKLGFWWIDCGKFTIDSVTVYTDGTGPVVTDAPSTKAPVTQAPATQAPVSDTSGGYTLKVNDDYDYSSMDEKMIGFKYEDFGIKAGEKVTKVEFNISTTAGKLGKWQGAVGTSTSVDPDYWTQSEDMEEVFTSNKGTITWTPDSATSKIIQTQYGGEVKLGFWWIDCGKFTIDSVTIYTDKSTTTNPPIVTVAPTTTKVTTKATTATNPPSSGSNLKGDTNCDGSVTAVDVVSMMQAMVGKKSLNSQALSNADINKDGKLSIVDLILLKNML